MAKLLLGENNKDFSYVIQWYFSDKGFKVYTATEGEKILNLYQENKPDIILLDIGLDGEIDGKEVARQIRLKDKETPIIFMSGENKSPTDVVDAFDIGCNFFLKKPISLEEIEVHINSVLSKNIKEADSYILGKASLNIKERLLQGNGIYEPLTEKETLVLKILIQHINSIVETTEILETVWGGDDREESLRNTISALRKKIQQTGASIETIKGKGYRLDLLS